MDEKKIHDKEIDGLLLMIDKNVAYVCTAEPLEHVLAALKRITGSNWVLSPYGVFGDSTNPTDCPDKPGNKHYRLVRRGVRYIESFSAQEVGLA